MKPARSASVISLIVFTLLAIQIAHGDSPPSTKPATTVTIENFRFEPGELIIAPGTTVTWKNADDVPHTATSKDEPQAFDSGPLDTDETFSFTFSKPGVYAYYCKVHPHMSGVITVK